MALKIKIISIISSLAIIGILGFSTQFYKAKCDELEYKIEIQQLKHKAEIAYIKFESQKEINKQYQNMTDTLAEQAKEIKMINKHYKTKVIHTKEIVERAKKDDDYDAAWVGANSDWGLPAAKN